MVQEIELVLLLSRIQIVQGVAITIGHPMRNPDYCNVLTFANLTASESHLETGGSLLCSARAGQLNLAS